MVSRQQKKQMLDYLVAKLEGSEEKVKPATKELIPGINSSYILLGDDGIVFLADQYYAGGKLEGLYSRNKQRFPRFGIVFYKDGKTFFRSAAEANYFKKENELSLKHYDDASMQKMMLLRPEEIFVQGLSDRVGVQYYQPESPRLTEALAFFRFGPVTFDYSHIPRENRFGPLTKESERLFIWQDRIETSENLTLKRCQLVERV